jgi:hypothetical protein
MIGRRLGVAAVLSSMMLFASVAGAEEQCTTEMSRATYLTRAGLLVEARDAMMSAGAECGGAREQAADLAWRIPKAFLHVAGRPASEVTVLLDGTPFDRSLLGAAQRMNPGEHVFVARTADGAERHATFVLAEGESKSITIDFLAGTLAVAQPRPVKAETAISPVAWGGFGVAAVGLAVGATTGILAMQKTKKLEEQCVGTSGICPASAIDDVESAKAYSTVSTISLLAAAGGATIGVIALMIGGGSKEAPKREASARVNVGPGSIGLAGTF